MRGENRFSDKIMFKQKGSKYELSRAESYHGTSL